MPNKKNFHIFIGLYFVLNIINTYFLTVSHLNRYIAPFRHSIVGEITSILGNFSVLLLIYFVVILLTKRRDKQMFVLIMVSLVLNIAIFALGIFNLYYGTAFSMNAISIFKNPASGIAEGMFSEIIYELINYYRVIVFLPSITLGIYYITMKKDHSVLNLHSSVKKVAMFLLSILLFFGSITSFTVQFKRSDLQIQSVIPTFGIQNMGVYPFYISMIFDDDFNLTTKASLEIETEEDLKKAYLQYNTNQLSYQNVIDGKTYSKYVTPETQANDLFVDPSLYKDETLTGIFKDKNLVLIHMESINYLMYELEDVFEYMPFTKSLFEESFVFRQFYNNVGMGVSSDAELSVLTGLYPNGYSTLYWDYNKKPIAVDTIPKLLNSQGYTTQPIHGDHKEFYNRDVVYQENSLIGFNQPFISIDDFDQDIIENGYEYIEGHFHKSNWVSDIQLADMIYDHAKDLDKFMLYPIMMMPHIPFEFNPIDIERPNYDKWISIENGISLRTQKYINYANYLDLVIKRFFLDEQDQIRTLDNTVYIFYSDHGSSLKNGDLSILYEEELSLMEERQKLQQTIAFIYAPGSNEVTHGNYTIKEGMVTGNQYLVRDQMDLYRTMVDLFGLGDEQTLYFGAHGLSSEPGYALENRLLDVVLNDKDGNILMYSLRDIRNASSTIADEEIKKQLKHILRLKQLNDLIYTQKDLQLQIKKAIQRK